MSERPYFIFPTTEEAMHIERMAAAALLKRWAREASRRGSGMHKQVQYSLERAAACIEYGHHHSRYRPKP